ncbi:hypothetical protein ACKF11_08835 [Methylobacillus sp. Pita2]|uniref:hypothetical protein n=1 Tax=Methylobacillus sp. Pita2 TaxID=3383245 RepID=UPI0038B5452F
MAIFGLRTRAADGTVLVEHTRRLPRVVDQFWTGVANGSRLIDLKSNEVNNSWGIITPGNSIGKQSPVLTISGQTVSWSFTANSVERVSIFVTIIRW